MMKRASKVMTILLIVILLTGTIAASGIFTAVVAADLQTPYESANTVSPQSESALTVSEKSEVSEEAALSGSSDESAPAEAAGTVENQASSAAAGHSTATAATVPASVPATPAVVAAGLHYTDNGTPSVSAEAHATGIAGVTVSYPNVQPSINTSPLNFVTAHSKISESDYYVYNTLNATQKALYTEIRNAVYLAQGTLRFSGSVSSFSAEDLRAAFRAFTTDHGECFWLDITASSITSSGSSVTLKLFYTDGSVTDNANTTADRSLISTQIRGFAEAANNIVSSIDSSAATVYKEKWLFDIVLSKVQYDYDYYNAARSGGYPTTAYGALMNGSANCAGYSNLLQFLLYQVGINCTKVSGSGHMWNMAQINGVWYHVDSTWADTNGGNYFYFNATEAQISTKNTVSKARQSIPSADTEFVWPF